MAENGHLERGEQRGGNETASTPHNLVVSLQTRLRSMQCGVILGRRSRSHEAVKSCGEMITVKAGGKR